MATIMMLTSGGHRGDATRCEELGVAAYLLKPIRQAELREAMSRVLGAMADNRATPMITNESIREGAAQKALNVLLAEDNKVNQKLALRMLEKRGHQVTVVENGLEALTAIQAEEFDLVLMDVHMPEMDGLEATRRLRAAEKESGGHQRVVAMTALVMKGDKERCLEAGMDGYLPKPIRSQDLDQALEQCMTERDGKQPEATQQEPAANQGAVDARDLMERIGGDREFLAELYETFREDYGKQMEAMNTALGAGDAAAMAHAAHSLKGALSNLAAKRASAQAADVEAAGKAGELAQAEAALRQLEPELDRVLQALSALCQEALP